MNPEQYIARAHRLNRISSCVFLLLFVAVVIAGANGWI